MRTKLIDRGKSRSPSWLFDCHRCWARNIKKAAASELIGVKKRAIFSLIYFCESICLYYIPQAMPHAIPQTHFPFYPHRLIVWIRKKLSKHQSYHKVKRAKRSVIWMHKKCTFYVQNSVSKGKKCFKPGRIVVHWWTSLNITIWKQPALPSYREVPKKTEPESKLTKKFYKIGHFRVPKSLTLKMRLGAQPFLWKWVIFAWESKAEHLPLFWHRGPGELGTLLFADVFSEVMLWSRDRVLS